MISMSKAYSIRQLRMEGDSIAEISRKLEVSRDTVYRHLAIVFHKSIFRNGTAVEILDRKRTGGP